MMTLQEILEAVDELSVDEQTSLFNVLQVKLAQTTQSSSNGETFWAMTLRFRERIEREGIEFTDEDFADLRDRSPGREVEL
jgi:hypothetical protein